MRREFYYRGRIAQPLAAGGTARVLRGGNGLPRGQSPPQRLGGRRRQCRQRGPSRPPRRLRCDGPAKVGSWHYVAFSRSSHSGNVFSTITQAPQTKERVRERMTFLLSSTPHSFRPSRVLKHARVPAKLFLHCNGNVLNALSARSKPVVTSVRAPMSLHWLVDREQCNWVCSGRFFCAFGF